MAAEANIPYEEREDGLLFHLHDDVKALVKWATSTKLDIELWRGSSLMAPEQGNLNSRPFRESLAKNATVELGRDGETDPLPNLERDLGRIALALRSKVDDDDSGDESRGSTLGEILRKMMGPKPTEVLIRYAREGGEFFHTAEMEPYVTALVGEHRETFHLKSRSYKLWLRHEYYRRLKLEAEGAGEEQTGTPVFPRNALDDVLNTLEAVALFESPEMAVHIRVAGSAGRIYIDLCDELWRAVEVSADGWRVVASEEIPVRFIRTKGMLALPEPARYGALGKLRDLLNIGEDAEGERNWRLILAWLAQAFTPTGPYPVLTLLGPQGAAKSSAQRILRNIVDASSVPLRSAPRDEHNLYIDATSSWVIALDNMSGLAHWLSDALCRLATGGGFSTRTLYTDRDQELFDAMRPVILNGIGDVITRPDLLDRALIINLPPIPRGSRKLERTLDAEIEATKPGVLGAIFDAISEGLSNLENVTLDELPRMADFARWGAATEQALGGSPGSFMNAYTESQEEAIDTALESWPIVAPLWKFARAYAGEENAWEGTASDLFKALNERASDDLKRAADWPKQPNVLTGQINRLAPSLVEVGIHVVRPSRSHKGGRRLKVFYVEPPRKRPSPSSPPSPEAENPHKQRDSEGDDVGDGLRGEARGDRPPLEGGRWGDDVGDGLTGGTVPQRNPIDKPNSAMGDDGDGGDDALHMHSTEKTAPCLHGSPGGKGCYLCDPDHPLRRNSA